MLSFCPFFSELALATVKFYEGQTRNQLFFQFFNEITGKS